MHRVMHGSAGVKRSGCRLASGCLTIAEIAVLPAKRFQRHGCERMALGKAGGVLCIGSTHFGQWGQSS